MLDAAAESNPNDLIAAGAAATGHLHCGSLDTALALYRRALRLDPHHTFAHVQYCGIAHLQIVLGHHAEALDAASRGLAINPNFDATHWMLVAGNAHLGRLDEARRFLAGLLRMTPDVTVARIRAGQPAKIPGGSSRSSKGCGALACRSVDGALQRFGSFHRQLKDAKRRKRPLCSGRRHAGGGDPDMITTLSIISLDQGRIGARNPRPFVTRPASRRRARRWRSGWRPARAGHAR